MEQPTAYGRQILKPNVKELQEKFADNKTFVKNSVKPLHNKDKNTEDSK